MTLKKLKPVLGSTVSFISLILQAGLRSIFKIAQISIFTIFETKDIAK